MTRDDPVRIIPISTVVGETARMRGALVEAKARISNMAFMIERLEIANKESIARQLHALAGDITAHIDRFDRIPRADVTHPSSVTEGSFPEGVMRSGSDSRESAARGTPPSDEDIIDFLLAVKSRFEQFLGSVRGAILIAHAIDRLEEQRQRIATLEAAAIRRFEESDYHECNLCGRHSHSAKPIPHEDDCAMKETGK